MSISGTGDEDDTNAKPTSKQNEAAWLACCRTSWEDPIHPHWEWLKYEQFHLLGRCTSTPWAEWLNRIHAKRISGRIMLPPLSDGIELNSPLHSERHLFVPFMAFHKLWCESEVPWMVANKWFHSHNCDLQEMGILCRKPGKPYPDRLYIEFGHWSSADLVCTCNMIFIDILLFFKSQNAECDFGCFCPCL